MKRAIILQGISGSGKSTYAKSLVAANGGRGLILSTDDFFLDKDGKYNFDGSKLGVAHSHNLFTFIESCRNEYELVICDNTNTTPAEVAAYYGPAEAYGYETEIHYVKCDPTIAAARNSHGVPLKAVEGMQKRIDAGGLPPWWTRKVISG
jgi:predicted kinase